MEAKAKRKGESGNRKAVASPPHQRTKHVTPVKGNLFARNNAGGLTIGSQAGRARHSAYGITCRCSILLVRTSQSAPGPGGHPKRTCIAVGPALRPAWVGLGPVAAAVTAPPSGFQCPCSHRSSSSCRFGCWSGPDDCMHLGIAAPAPAFKTLNRTGA